MEPSYVWAPGWPKFDAVSLGDIDPTGAERRIGLAREGCPGQVLHGKRRGEPMTIDLSGEKGAGFVIVRWSEVERLASF